LKQNFKDIFQAIQDFHEENPTTTYTFDNDAQQFLREMNDTFIVRTVKVVNIHNCAFFYTNSKLVYLIEFAVLKNIGLGPQCQRGF
jgi:hypothetical protein